MVTFLDGATESHWVGVHEEQGLRNSSNVLLLFQDCYKNIYSI